MVWEGGLNICFRNIICVYILFLTMTHLKSVYSRPEVKRKLAPGSEGFSLPGVRQVLEDVVEDYSQTGELKDVGQHGDR